MPKDLLQSFRSFVARENLFTHRDKLLLACSGGLDSTVLAHLLHAEGYDFEIAHMNFQLRGEESDGDAVFVENLARSLGAKFWTKAVDVKAEAKNGESTQMTCRRIRYEWLFWESIEHECDYFLTAHQLDDNIETFMLNLIRGTGIEGLTGITPKSTYKNLCVRPLLEASREMIREFAVSNRIDWREDASNQSDDYRRNEIRHHLTPVFRMRFGLTDQGVTRTFQNLRFAEKMYHAGLSEHFAHSCTYMEGILCIDRSKWNNQEDLFHFLCTFLHQFRKPAPFEKYTREQFRQMIDAPGNLVIRGEYGHTKVSQQEIIFFPWTYGNDQAKLSSIILNSLESGFENDKVQINLIERPTNLNDPNHLYLAPPSFPLHLRPRQNGDRFQPLGLNGRTKKVKDYMIDAKIPVWLRDRIYLLTDANDEIMAIPGYCISEKFKVQPEHEEVLRISWQ